VKKDNIFIQALKIKEGQTSFIIAVVSTALLFPIGKFLGSSHFGFFIMLAVSMLSLSSAQQFARILVAIRDSQDD